MIWWCCSHGIERLYASADPRGATYGRDGRLDVGRMLGDYADEGSCSGIVDRLRSMDYYYYTSGVRAIDFARFAEIQ
jgi:hypothetical protein